MILRFSSKRLAVVVLVLVLISEAQPCLPVLPRVLRLPVPLDKGNEGSKDKIGQESEESGVEM